MNKILIIFATLTGLILSELPTQAKSTHQIKEESDGMLRRWVYHRLTQEQLSNIVSAAKYSKVYYENAPANAKKASVRFDVPSGVPSKKRSNRPALRDTFTTEHPILGLTTAAAQNLTDHELKYHLLRTWGGQLNAFEY